MQKSHVYSLGKSQAPDMCDSPLMKELPGTIFIQGGLFPTHLGPWSLA